MLRSVEALAALSAAAGCLSRLNEYRPPDPRSQRVGLAVEVERPEEAVEVDHDHGHVGHDRASDHQQPSSERADRGVRARGELAQVPDLPGSPGRRPSPPAWLPPQVHQQHVVVVAPRVGPSSPTRTFVRRTLALPWNGLGSTAAPSGRLVPGHLVYERVKEPGDRDSVMLQVSTLT